MHKLYRQSAFTIVELLIVIVIIGILATLVIVAYNGISRNAAVSVLQSDLANARTQLGIDRVNSDSETYPDDIDDYKHSDGVTLEYTSDGDEYCVTASSEQAGTSYNLDSTTNQITEGTCDGHSGVGDDEETATFIQTINEDNCPTTRAMVVDARDSNTYWVQKLDDDKCWMLTNLAYAGGGTDTYGDVKTLTNGTGGSVNYAVASYYMPTSGSNVTTDPTEPSTSTTGSGQYGYLYNWCGAMGAQSGTSACANATTPAPDTDVSVCPAGWRLPTGGASSEFADLNTTVNSGATNTDAGLRTTWLGQRSGSWSSGFSGQGNWGYFWSSTQVSGAFAYIFFFSNGSVQLTNNQAKYTGFAVRCIAD